MKKVRYSGKAHVRELSRGDITKLTGITGQDPIRSDRRVNNGIIEVDDKVADALHLASPTEWVVMEDQTDSVQEEEAPSVQESASMAEGEESSETTEASSEEKPKGGSRRRKDTD